MDVHHVALGIEVHVPDFLEQRRASDHFVGVEKEVLQELEFLGGEVHGLARHMHGVAQAVQADVPELEGLQPLGSPAANQGPHPGEQLIEVERLRHVVIRARVQTPDHIRDRIA